MKLEMTLPERPGLLHAVPLVNLIMLLWVLFLLVPSLTRQAGVMVELPPSKFQLDHYPNTVVITLRIGEPEPFVYFGRNLVGMKGLAAQLEKLKKEGAPGHTLVLLQTDAGTPVSLERQVAEMVLQHGFRLATVGTPNKEGGHTQDEDTSE